MPTDNSDYSSLELIESNWPQQSHPNSYGKEGDPALVVKNVAFRVSDHHSHNYGAIVWLLAGPAPAGQAGPCLH